VALPVLLMSLPGCCFSGPRLEELLRELAPQVLGVLARRTGQFDAAEDAVQEALLAAARRTTSLPEQRYLEARANRMLSGRHA
jgi:DNA-directed RNA polymerase specialized sigma24 family protein